jgi:hypothetical protein
MQLNELSSSFMPSQAKKGSRLTTAALEVGRSVKITLALDSGRGDVWLRTLTTTPWPLVSALDSRII